MSQRKILTQILVLLAILTAAYYLHKFGFFEKALNFIDSFGPWAPVIFVIIFALTCVFFFPAFIFSFAGGILFGVYKGVPLSLLGLGIGSVTALLIGRYLLRDWITRVFMDNAEFHLLDDAVRIKGWKIVTLARLSPIFPFLIGNYAFGTSKISAGHYFLATILGSIPSMTVYNYIGELAGDMASLDLVNRSRTPAEWALAIGGLFATIVLTWYLRRVAKKALDTVKA